MVVVAHFFMACFHVTVFVVPFLFVTMGVRPRKLQGVHNHAELNHPGLIRLCIVDQVIQPVGFQSQPDGEDNVGIGDSGHIPAPGHEGMGIAAGRQQGEYVGPVAAYHPGPVTCEVGSSNNLDGRS